MPSASAGANILAFTPSFCTASATFSAMGIIISVVAVLEIHIESSAAATMNPRIMALGREPKAATTLSAMRACRFQRSIASATMNPPSSNMTMGLANGLAAWPALAMPRKGNRASGTRAVAAIGMASVAHQAAMSRAREASSQASRDSPPGTGMSWTIRASPSPATSPTPLPLSIAIRW